MVGLVTKCTKRKTTIFDATCLKAHRTARGLRESGLREKRMARAPDLTQFEDEETVLGTVSVTAGGMNTQLHAVADAKRRPIRFYISAGKVSDYSGAAALLGSLPKAVWQRL